MRIILLLLPAFCFLAACSNEIKPDDLYGRWDYIKVENRNPEDQLPEGELELQKPAIIFSAKGDSLVIQWGGSRLSKGVFRMDGKMIRYTEDLAGGIKRSFPFIIRELSKDELIFETMEQNVTRVVARRSAH